MEMALRLGLVLHALCSIAAGAESDSEADGDPWSNPDVSKPWAPAGLPGRLKDSLPTLNQRASEESRVTALIISASVERFRRAAEEIQKSDVQSTVWIPAVVLNETNYTLCGGGGNGLRHAMRNAWALIASTGIGMAVFEDDVAFAGMGRNLSVSEFITSQCLRASKRCDLAYLGEWNNFFTTHAIYIRPHAAEWLLNLTSTCFPFGVHIDQGMHARCVHRPGRYPPLNCIHPPGWKLPGAFGQGFFVQDRQHIPSYLHRASGNKPISRS